MRVAILGRHQILYSTAETLLRDGRHSLACVITAPAPEEYLKREGDFEHLAKNANVPFLLKKKLDADAVEMLMRSEADVCLSVNWVSVIGGDVTGIFKHGILNAHFGDLPRYRGNAVANWALLNREKSIHLTVHFMDGGELDSGDILAQLEMPLDEQVTILDINLFAERNTPGLFLRALADLESGRALPKSQKAREAEAFRCYPRLPMDGKIDWNRSAVDLHALIRSLTKPYSGAYTFHRWKGSLRRLYIWESRVVSAHTGDLGVPGHVIKNDPETGESWVYCGEGILAVKSCSYDGDQPIEPGSHWNSIRMRLGMDVEEELFLLSKAQGTIQSN
jgi:methionyl-tRNA formyltransferase